MTAYPPAQCVVCSATFIPQTRTNKIYCSQYCREQGRRLRARHNGGTFTAQDKSDLLQAQELRCFYCDALLDNPNVRHTEHIKSRRNGGSDDAYNRVMACTRCNIRKYHLCECADALLNDLFRRGILNLDEIWHKAQVLKTNREYEINQSIWVYRTKSGIAHVLEQMCRGGR